VGARQNRRKRHNVNLKIDFIGLLRRLAEVGDGAANVRKLRGTVRRTAIVHGHSPWIERYRLVVRQRALVTDEPMGIERLPTLGYFPRVAHYLPLPPIRAQAKSFLN
jgi:hypothetical protein